MKSQKVSEQTYRFEFEKPISHHEFLIETAQKSASSPLAKKLFGFPWTEAVRILPQSVELTKKDWVDWDILLEPLQGLLEEHVSQVTTLEEDLSLRSGKQSNGVSGTKDLKPESDESLAIKQFITESINPSLAMHGGWVELKSFENQTAYLGMGGGCQGCASSQATMIDGIENALKGNFSFVQRVIDVTDHASGDNPYY